MDEPKSPPPLYPQKLRKEKDVLSPSQWSLFRVLILLFDAEETWASSSFHESTTYKLFDLFYTMTTNYSNKNPCEIKIYNPLTKIIPSLKDLVYPRAGIATQEGHPPHTQFKEDTAFG